jgi:CBS domain containing-hemolysin-like protein
MLLAAVVSMFCSVAEAVFFSLSSHDRRRFQFGSRLQRLAASLATRSGKLLPVILFCNLMANLTIFASSTAICLELQKAGRSYEAGMLVLGTLFGVIIFCEIIPKSLGVTLPRLLAPLFALPMSLLGRVFGPLIPWLEHINLLSQRLILPNLKPEPDLQVSDLERMIELMPRRKKHSTDRIAPSLSFSQDEAQQPATLLRREQQVLRNIVGLSDISAEEMMRPRKRLRLFKPPVTLASLQGSVPPGGYLLITEPDTDEIASAIPLDCFTGTTQDNAETATWDAQSDPVVYVPWRMKASHVLETLQKEKKEVAAVVNEYGETIGILSFDDLVYSIFAIIPSRSRLLFNKPPIRRDGEGRWCASTMTTLRRIERYFQRKLPDHEPSTVGGILEETLERFPQEGDQCDWGPFHWRVLAKNEAGIFDVEITISEPEGGEL